MDGRCGVRAGVSVCICLCFSVRLAAAALFRRLAVGVEASSLWRRRFVLDPRLCGIQVQAAVLDVLVDLLGSFQEGVLHVFTSGHRRGAQKGERRRRRREKGNGIADRRS